MLKNVLLSASILMSISTNCTADTKSSRKHLAEFATFFGLGAVQELIINRTNGNLKKGCEIGAVLTGGLLATDFVKNVETYNRESHSGIRVLAFAAGFLSSAIILNINSEKIS